MLCFLTLTPQIYFSYQPFQSIFPYISILPCFLNPGLMHSFINTRNMISVYWNRELADISIDNIRREICILSDGKSIKDNHWNKTQIEKYKSRLLNHTVYTFLAQNLISSYFKRCETFNFPTILMLLYLPIYLECNKSLILWHVPLYFFWSRKCPVYRMKWIPW